MFIQGKDIQAGKEVKADICIVGAGAAGLTIALEFLHSPLRVVVLESGGMHYDERSQSLNDGQSVGQAYYPLQSSRMRLFGGTTALWAGFCTPLDDIDFQQRAWVPESGWPISLSELQPFYHRADKVLGIHSEQQLQQKITAQLDPFSLDNNVVFNKYWRHSSVRFGRTYQQHFKQARNIDVFLHSTVVDILCDSNIQRVKKLVVKNRQGDDFFVSAKNVVLACGAIQNARLLLASRSQMKQGLGNAYDLVGRYFMEHIEMPFAELRLFQSLPTDIYIRQKSHLVLSAELAINSKIQQQKQILNGTVTLVKKRFAQHVLPRLKTWNSPDPRLAMRSMLSQWKDATIRAERSAEIQPNTYELVIRLEQAPNQHSRIQLSSEKDRFGMPKVALDWRLGELEKHSIFGIYDVIAREFGKQGLGRIKLYDSVRQIHDWQSLSGVDGGWHHMGVTKMGKDAYNGVVNPQCQVYGLSNLYIASSACFPTSGAANPSYTLIALALRLADHLKQQTS